ncbi:zinc finger, CCHC-type containing protein [Tanacetum coccineum]
MGDKNPICTLGDYSRPSHEGYQNTIELHDGKNMVPLRSDTIRLVQNECSFHALRSEYPNQHLKDFIKLVDSLDLDIENGKGHDCIYFNFPFAIKLEIGLNVFPRDPSPLGRISLPVSFFQFFPPGRNAKLHNDILMFQQYQGESLSEAWTRFKDLLQKVRHHDIDLWL